MKKIYKLSNKILKKMKKDFINKYYNQNKQIKIKKKLIKISKNKFKKNKKKTFKILKKTVQNKLKKKISK